MSDKPTIGWPARGEVSADRRFYTHTDGSVHERDPDNHYCTKCSLFQTNCDNVPCYGTQWNLVEGAYVPSADELAACDGITGHCKRCAMVLMGNACPARRYLDRCGQPDAWEVK